MKNKKMIMYIFIIVLVFILLILGILVYKKIVAKTNLISDYIPAEEMSDSKMRQTLVTLYFLNINTGELESEIRELDSKELLENPYSKIISLLNEETESQGLSKLIPENTILNSTSFEGGILRIDFSKEFIENQNLGQKQEELIISSIVKTLKELNEINSIIFLIDGEENRGFPDGGVSFDKAF